MLTVKQAIDSGIEHALNGPPSHAFEPLALVNLAGQHLIGMYRWEWCKRRVASLNLRAGRDMIELPDDFAGLEAIETIDNTSIAVRMVSQGRKYVTPEMAQMLVDNLTTPAQEDAHQKLSDRELQTLVMIASGKRLSDIAEQLLLSPKTVSVYRARVLEKLQLANNSELTVYAIRNGLVAS